MSQDAWGIVDRYQDASGVWHETLASTREAIRSSMGPIDPQLSQQRPVWVLKQGEQAQLPGPCRLQLEDGSELAVEGHLPGDLPLGYHWLWPTDSERAIRIIVTPGKCYLPEGYRTWAWVAQLYATRSQSSWGIGDFGDLKQLSAWSARQGAGLLIVNPLVAGPPTLPQEPSPYYPSSRRYRNLLYLRVEEVPGAERLGDELAEIAQAGRALNDDRRINRDAVYGYKRAALEKIWPHFAGDPEFEQYCHEQGKSLQQYAAYCVLSERFGADWRRWPTEYRQPESSATHRLMEESRDRVRFHAWVQWLLDRQLSAAASELPIMQDLPIGFDPGGADAWAWQDLLALDMHIGAPPDLYNTGGQNWGLPPFIPHKLLEARYEPYIETIRACLRHAGGLRIDHIIGLFRLFWIPAGAPASHGTYVRYQAEEMLDILTLESVRANAVIVGEDLGTVEEHVRHSLSDHRLLSYRVLYFEPQPPQNYPYLSLATVTTHDLPTVAGLWSGRDLEVQRQLGLNPNEQGMQELRGRLQELSELHENAGTDEAIEAAHRALARAPSAILTATLEDAVGVQERPNMPGTMQDKWPNWSVALPEGIEELEHSETAQAIAKALNRRAAMHEHAY